MLDTFFEELARRDALIKEAKCLFTWEDVAPNAMVFRKKSGEAKLNPDGKTVSWTLGCLVHGNEVGGLRVINQVLEELIKGGICLCPGGLGLFWGNIEAGKEGKRFLERDLNRSFSLGGQNSGFASLEAKRARELEKLLSQTRYFLDFHQTIVPAKHPFFIFPYNKECLELASYLDPRAIIVTHCNGGFSADGAGSDGFVQAKGGIGLSLELGQIGWLSGIDYGVSLAKAAIEGLGSLESGGLKSADLQIFEIFHSISRPAKSRALLLPGLENFSPVQKGDRLGVFIDENKEETSIYAQETGFLLFPKYEEKLPFEKLSSEIVRIVQKTDAKTLAMKIRMV